MPLQLPAIRIERQQRTCIKVVTRPNVAVVIRAGIARAPVNKVQFRIEGAGYPGRSSAVLPCIAAPLPGLRARFARCWYRPEAPYPLAGFRIVSIEESANAAFCARDSHDHLIFDYQRGTGSRVIEAGVGEVLFPEHTAGTRIERDELGIQRCQVKSGPEDREATIDLAAANIDVGS